MNKKKNPQKTKRQKKTKRKPNKTHKAAEGLVQPMKVFMEHISQRL